jgi:hypothetical protein
MAVFAVTVTFAFGMVNEVAGLEGFSNRDIYVPGSIVHTLKFASSFATIVTEVPPLTFVGKVEINVPPIMALPFATVRS